MAAKTRRAPRALALAAVLLAGPAGCGPVNEFKKPEAPEVTVARPTRREVTNYFEATGTAQPVFSVDIRARVRGFLKERTFKEGSIVRKGQPLLLIDEEPFRVALDQARTRLAEAEATLKKARQSRAREVARAQLALDQSQLQLARIDETRQKTLMSRNAGTREEMDRVEANLGKNAAQVEATRASLEQAEADYETNILSADANAGAARAAARDAEINLGYCRMAAPIDGRITRSNFDVGNLVGDGSSSLLATIVTIDPIYAYINVGESDLLKYWGRKPEGEAMPMELALASDPPGVYPHPGEFNYQDPSVDTSTGTIRVRGKFPNGDGAILPGLFVRIRVPFERVKDALLVPDKALASDQSGEYVLVVDRVELDEGGKKRQADRVAKVAVTSGAKLDGLRVVSARPGTSGKASRSIGPDDRVIVEGLLRAREGVEVVPKDLAEAAKAVAAVP